MAKQLRFDQNMKITEENVDVKENTDIKVVEEDGTPVDVFRDFRDMGRALTSGKYDNKDLTNFEAQADVVFQNTLTELLREQDKEPFKHGGETIAYRSDIIILRNRSKMTAAENVLFDIISGIVSSNPTQKSFSIDVRDIAGLLPYKDKSYAYKLLDQATETMKSKTLRFEVKVNGKMINLEYPMFNPILYVSSLKNRKSGVSYISFVPSDFLRVLLITAGKIHGAYYPITGPAQISGKYQKTFYYYLESKKDYRETPYSRPGMFSVSLEELREMIGYPSSYKVNDIKRFVVESTQKDVEEIPEIDFVFSYEIYKEAVEGGKKKAAGFRFIIDRKAVSIEEQTIVNKDDERLSAMRTVLKEYGYEQREISEIVAFCDNNNVSYKTLNESLIVADRANIKTNKVSYLLTVLKNGIFNKSSTPSISKQSKAKPTGFSNFQERKVDYDEIEMRLIRESMKMDDGDA